MSADITGVAAFVVFLLAAPAAPLGMASAATSGPHRAGASRAASHTATVVSPVIGCVGDWNGDGLVTVSELISGVGTALGLFAPEACAAFDSGPGEKATVDGLVTALLNAQHGCVSAHARDLSAFDEFSFSRQRGLGFCPPLRAVFSAAIHGADEHRYALEMSVLDEGRRGIDDCLPDLLGFRGEDVCAVVRPQAPRFLHPAEIERVREVFARVEVYDEPDPICQEVAYDPCLINAARWDRLSGNDYICSRNFRLGNAQMSAILALLEELRSASPR